MTRTRPRSELRTQDYSHARTLEAAQRRLARAEGRYRQVKRRLYPRVWRHEIVAIDWHPRAVLLDRRKRQVTHYRRLAAEGRL